jgi:predicted metalloprotease
MQFDDDRVDTSKVDDLRGRGRSGGGGMGGGGMGGAATAGLIAMLMRGKGGKGMVLALLLVGALMVFGGGGGLFSSGQQSIAPPDGAAQDLEARCNTSGAIQQYPDCLLTKAFNETDEVWEAEFARLGQTYTAPRLVFFSNSVNTACGPASTAVGPFYCPGDQRIYFDLGFADQLNKLGVKGDYANVYIMAHEFGHHLQNITGIEKQVRAQQAQDSRNANALSVQMELQADCFAGVWGRMANDRGNLTITQAELADAQNAAAAVGDDRIQAGAGQRVNPESWTHGSAQQRQQWYLVGYNSGDINRCSTFTP